MTKAATLTHSNWAAADHPEFNDGFEAALRRRTGQGERLYAPIIAGRAVATTRVADDRSPADPSLLIARVGSANADHVDQAMSAAARGFCEWRRQPLDYRVAAVRRLADLIDRDRLAFAALLSLEIGKNRFEAATEVEEAVALLRFYADQITANDGFNVDFPPLGDERSVSVMKPYGVWGIYGPFNFPLALVVGMTGAALLTGNTTVIKPPDHAPLPALELARLMLEAGFPAETINVLPGTAKVGKAIAKHGCLAGIGFTGSRKVGTALRRQLDGRPVVAEMGGKNAAMVAASADLEMAAEGVWRSAFRFSGQKCSACSRVYVHATLQKSLVAAIGSRLEKLPLGIPWDGGGMVGPLIDQRARQRYDEALVEARDAGAEVIVGDLPEGLPEGAAYVPPAIVVGLPDDHWLLRRELFAPILCVQTFTNLQAAIGEANAVDYGLTAGLYSQDDADIRAFLETIEAGVVYVNRPSGATTGAWVGHQSFGGWKSSGSTGKNAHGKYYLLQFLREQSQTVVG